MSDHPILIKRTIASAKLALIGVGIEPTALKGIATLDEMVAFVDRQMFTPAIREKLGDLMEADLKTIPIPS